MQVTEEQHRYMRHVPNTISFGRGALGLIATIWVAFNPMALYDPLTSGVLAVVLALIYATDWVDGYLARRYKVVSKLGAILDTSVDKLVIVVPSIGLAALGLISENSVLNWGIVALTLLREVAISIAKPVAEKHGVTMSVQQSGRVKMAVQCAAVVLSVWSVTRGDLSLFFFGGAVVLSLYSLFDYYVEFQSQRREVKAAL